MHRLRNTVQEHLIKAVVCKNPVRAPGHVNPGNRRRSGRETEAVKNPANRLISLVIPQVTRDESGRDSGP